jgi:hypothetical protein
MGVDIELRSVFTEDVAEAACARARRDGGDPREYQHASDPREYLQAIGAIYDAYAATGGHFRDPYNASGLFHALGWDWDDVGQMLDADHLLPIPAARHLLAELEARPLTPAMVEDIYTGRAKRAATLTVIHTVVGEPEYEIPSPEQMAVMTARLIKKRATLMALLRRSIDLNEPLHCSL